MSDELTYDQPGTLARPLHEGGDMPIERVLALAVEQKATPEAIGKLVDLYERLQGIKAKKSFQAAMTRFRDTCPPIPRRTENTQFKVTRNGVQTYRKYATLEDIEATIRSPLADCGLSFRWGDTTIQGGLMLLACIVSHIDGHSESSSVPLPVDSKAGCSDQQKYGAAMTYAQRYSLIQALGLTTCDEDDDGHGSGPTPITAHQAANLQALVDEVKADKPKLLAFLGVSALSECPASRFAEVVRMLEAKRAKR